MDQPALRKGGVVRSWIAALGGEVVLYEADLPACCQRSAHRSGGAEDFECPSCGAIWQVPVPVEPEEDAFTAPPRERRGAA